MVLDVGEIMGIVESFVITSAPNTRLVRAIVDEVERQLFEQTGDKPRAVEGLRDAVVGAARLRRPRRARVPDRDARVLRLERLWADAARCPGPTARRCFVGA